MIKFRTDTSDYFFSVVSHFNHRIFWPKTLQQFHTAGGQGGEDIKKCRAMFRDFIVSLRVFGNNIRPCIKPTSLGFV